MTKKTILALNAAWVFVGEAEPVSPRGTILLRNAACIRKWGTEHGLGQLALKGPTTETVLDRCGDLTVPAHQVLFSMDCPGWL